MVFCMPTQDELEDLRKAKLYQGAPVNIVSAPVVEQPFAQEVSPFDNMSEGEAAEAALNYYLHPETYEQKGVLGEKIDPVLMATSLAPIAAVAAPAVGAALGIGAKAAPVIASAVPNYVKQLQGGLPIVEEATKQVATAGMSSLGGINLRGIPLAAAPFIFGASYALTRQISNGIEGLVNLAQGDPNRTKEIMNDLEKVVFNSTYMKSLGVSDRQSLWTQYLASRQLLNLDINSLSYPYSDLDNPVEEQEFTPWQEYQIWNDERYFNARYGSQPYYPDKAAQAFYSDYYDEAEEYYGELLGFPEDGGFNGYGSEQWLNGYLDELY